MDGPSLAELLASSQAFPERVKQRRVGRIRAYGLAEHRLGEEEAIARPLEQELAKNSTHRHAVANAQTRPGDSDRGGREVQSGEESDKQRQKLGVLASGVDCYHSALPADSLARGVR
jgi:hypothetical protein